MSGRKEQKPLSRKTRLLLAELKRRSGVRELEKRYLIVCEDEKSAVNYFKALIKRYGISATSVEVAGSGGHTQPIQVVRKAMELKTASARRESGTLPFHHVWCVIDGDYGKKIHNARASATEHGIDLAVSTMCFEYWVILHFEETARPTTCCNEVVESLKRSYIKDYEKGKCQFSGVVEHVRVACKRAERLRKPGIARGELPEDQNPCTEVYTLVNAILGPEEKGQEVGSRSDAVGERTESSARSRSQPKRAKGKRDARSNAGTSQSGREKSDDAQRRKGTKR